MTLSKTWLLRVASSVNADSANVAALANDVKPNVGAPSPMQLYVALAKDSTNASNAGYATSSGSANRASSAGTSDTAKGLSITGFGNSNLTFYQTSASVQGSVSDWASYIMANHGSGASYYNQTLRLPFWGAPQIGRLENGANRGWQTLATESYVNSKVSSGGIVAQSLGTNGYVKFSNGLIIQWGQVGEDTASYVSLPRCFTYANYSLANGVISDAGRNPLTRNIAAAYSKGACGFYKASSNYAFNWIAIGY